jgi:hypothetical protein
MKTNDTQSVVKRKVRGKIHFSNQSVNTAGFCILLMKPRFVNISSPLYPQLVIMTFSMTTGATGATAPKCD